MSGKDLNDASGKGDLTEVKRLLDAGADVNWRNDVRDILYYSVVCTVEIDKSVLYYRMDLLLLLGPPIGDIPQSVRCSSTEGLS